MAKRCKTSGCEKQVTRQGLCWGCLKAAGIDPKTGKPIAPADPVAAAVPEASAASDVPADLQEQAELGETSFILPDQVSEKFCDRCLLFPCTCLEDGFPYDGPPIRELSFETIAAEIGALVDEKNRAYGNSFAQCGEFLRLLYPCGVRPDQYTDMLGLVRIFDKQMRIATDADALGESPWSDIAGYGILGLARKKGML